MAVFGEVVFKCIFFDRNEFIKEKGESTCLRFQNFARVWGATLFDEFKTTGDVVLFKFGFKILDPFLGGMFASGEQDEV